MLAPVTAMTSMQEQKNCVNIVDEEMATEAAKIAAPLCNKLKNEKTLITLNPDTFSNLAVKMSSLNNLQNRIFLNL